MNLKPDIFSLILLLSGLNLATAKECMDARPADVIILMDGSGSVGAVGFDRALEFVNELIDAFHIGPNATQIAMVVFTGDLDIRFNLSTFHSAYYMKQAVNSTRLPVGPTEDIAGSLRLAYQMFLNPSKYGGRPSASRIVILMTDGASGDITPSVNAASLLKGYGVTVFTAGVGTGIREEELKQVTTNSSYYFKADHYGALDGITTSLTGSACTDLDGCICFNGGTCTSSGTSTKCVCPSLYSGLYCEKAPFYINSTYRCEISSCPTLAYLVGKNGATIETNISCGGINIFSAVNNPNPSSAQHEYMHVSRPGQPSHTYFGLSDTTLFMNLKDNQGPYLNASKGCRATITPYQGYISDKYRNVKCYLGLAEVPCDDSFFNCTETWNFPNPCTQANVLAGKLRFPHPYDSKKFLMCDLSGKVYVVLCPKGEIFKSDCSQCIGENVTLLLDCNNPLSTGMTNPCTRENILAGHMYFMYPGDANKYIHCDVWGHPWERQCPAGMEWGQDLQTCFIPGTINPCLHHQPGQPYLYPHSCDPHRYIHCDTNHQSFEQSCQLDFVFYASAQVCVPPGSYPGTENLVNTCYGATTQYPQLGHPSTVYYGTTTNPVQSHAFNTQPYAEPCTLANIQANELYFAYKYNNHNYIQCDLYGHAYLRDCSPNYYDPYSHTCVDGPVFVDNQLGSPVIGK